MTDERVTEEMARLEFEDTFKWLGETGLFCAVETSDGIFGFEDTMYLMCHNACQRVIEGLSDREIENYHYRLWEVTAQDGTPSAFYKAAPRQKCEAILRAVGKWRKTNA